MTAFPAYANSADPATPLTVAPLAGNIGAEISDINLSDRLDGATFDAIKAALLRHKVIFFRNQALSNETHEALAEFFGEPVAHPTVPVAEGSRYLLDLDSREGFAASSWHTDVTFVDAYPKISLLRAITTPAAGGDTLWANGVTAYEALPEHLKQLADGLWAVHTNLFDYAQTLGRNADQLSDRYRSVFASTVYETEHPVVRVHPETGERALLLGHFVKQFVGLNLADSHRIFNTLQEHATKPEHTVRWRWRPGDLAIWDNRATQHRAIADFGLQRRTLRRATVAGDVPVGVDGRKSRIIKQVVQPRLEPAE